jgi:effector-binding domain-containing protein
MILFHDDYRRSIDQKLKFETCISVESEEKKLKHVIKIPAGKYATIRHTGNREGSIEYYQTMLNYLNKNNLKTEGPLIKIYLVSYAHSKSKNNISCEMQVKVSCS